MKRLLVAMTAVAAVGCAAPKTMYAWGSYEELIYASYVAPGSVAPEQQIEKLVQDFQTARAEDKRMPPGWHAHLSYLYAQVGKRDQAQQELRTEKAEYPESTVFVDRLLANLN
jgi:hypothetical protein